MNFIDTHVSKPDVTSNARQDIYKAALIHKVFDRVREGRDAGKELVVSHHKEKIKWTAVNGLAFQVAALGCGALFSSQPSLGLCGGEHDSSNNSTYGGNQTNGSLGNLTHGAAETDGGPWICTQEAQIGSIVFLGIGALLSTVTNNAMGWIQRFQGSYNRFRSPALSCLAKGGSSGEACFYLNAYSSAEKYLKGIQDEQVPWSTSDNVSFVWHKVKQNFPPVFNGLRIGGHSPHWGTEKGAQDIEAQRKRLYVNWSSRTS